MPRGSRRPQGLAIVAVDNAEVVAPAVVSLAASNASQGKQVVIADLSDGSHAARRLGSRKPGIHAVRADGADFVVMVPERDDIALVGPIPGSQARACGTSARTSPLPVPLRTFCSPWPPSTPRSEGITYRHGRPMR